MNKTIIKILIILEVIVIPFAITFTVNNLKLIDENEKLKAQYEEYKVLKTELDIYTTLNNNYNDQISENYNLSLDKEKLESKIENLKEQIDKVNESINNLKRNM